MWHANVPCLSSLIAIKLFSYMIITFEGIFLKSCLQRCKPKRSITGRVWLAHIPQGLALDEAHETQILLQLSKMSTSFLPLCNTSHDGNPAVITADKTFFC
mmetsp:Transcript_13282/g.53607  ORF Transcript_13282/g.53607 Transcript_13282/m.53607 type:complete len:101 (+) Transcript_13282:3086-3388(+)